MVAGLAGLLPQNTRSPACASANGSLVPAVNCARDVRGSGPPATPKAPRHKPEESDPPGPVAPHRYGLPSCCFAPSIARAATPVTSAGAEVHPDTSAT